MFGNSKSNRIRAWFPGQKPTLDRWGEPVGAALQGREFRSETAPAGETARMRWSLGLI